MNWNSRNLLSYFSGILATIAFFLGPAVFASIVSVQDPTTKWTVVASPNPMDYVSDQQTGQAAADIVGSSVNPGFYTGFDGTNVYFRVRFGATARQGQTTAFSGLFWVGVDANDDGRIDFFIGVNNQGSTRRIAFHDAGAGLNNSPSTTTIATSLTQYRIAQNGTNFHYSSVNSTLQPGISNTDLNADGGIDAFLSFRVPFFGLPNTATFQGAAQGLGGISIDQNSPIRYIIATSTQQNSLNQDIGSLDNKNFDPTSTWIALGGITGPLTLNGTPYSSDTAPVPEPSAAVLLLVGFAMITTRVRRRSL